LFLLWLLRGRLLLQADLEEFRLYGANAIPPNPNIEYRNPKQIQNSNSQMPETGKQQMPPGVRAQKAGIECFGIRILIIVACFGFRALDFGFIFDHPPDGGA
jgi:hypothetical protein